MGRAPCCDKANVKRGPWSPEEDAKLKDYIEKSGTGGNWIALPQKAGLKRCGKSCRLRWLNYLRPNIKHGEFSDDEDRIIFSLFNSIGSRWSIIAAQLPGRTDNDIKNYWNTKLKKKLLGPIHQSNLQHERISRPQYLSPFPLAPSSNTNSHLLQNYSMMASPYSSLDHSQMISYEPGNDTTYYPNPSMNMAFTTPLSQTTISPSFQQAQDVNLGLNQSSYRNNVVAFGGEDPASCSSSDGSCATNQINQVEQDHGENNLGLKQNYFSNGVDHGYEQKAGPNDENNIINNDNSTLDYSIEEIKQLISTNNVCSNNNLNFFLDGPSIIKTEDKEITYYC